MTVDQFAGCECSEQERSLPKWLGPAVFVNPDNRSGMQKEKGKTEMGSKKILLVDDSSTARLVTRLIFSQKSNYVLLSAVDGKDAIERAHAEKPDLILMDVMMPRMTGLEACRALKQDKETSQIPVILLTTRGEEKFVQEGYESGCSDYLTKPVNDTELLDLLKAYLGE